MIAIIDYGVGNLFSAEKAFAALGADVRVTSDESTIRQADKIVLPGVGAFGDCMKNLEESGLIPVLKESVAAGKPLLGICVGLQVLFDGSEESPGAKGLGLIHGMVKKIQAPGLKVPHMGWNSIKVREPREKLDLFKGLSDKPYVYFVHSYHAVPEDKSVMSRGEAADREKDAALLHFIEEMFRRRLRQHPGHAVPPGEIRRRRARHPEEFC